MSVITDDVAKMWRGLLETDEVAEDADFFECGGNSITAVHLAALIQERLGVAVDAIEVVRLRTFGGIAGCVEERVSAG